MLKIIASTDEQAIAELLTRSGDEIGRAERIVAPIIADVRKRGDAALVAWTKKLESVTLQLPGGKAAGVPLRYGKDEFAAAFRRIPAPLRKALKHARANIERMARWQLPKGWMKTTQPGVQVGQAVRPLESVGCYVPGGRHPLPSTLLMTAVPARVAGVGRVVVTCPNPCDEVLAAAHVAGVDAVFRIGGAQAVAALAYGTETVPRVEKIVGPGNVYVTAAKKLVWGDCGIDFLAGPTEVLAIAGADADPDFVASDLIAQAEHDPQATAWLLTPSRKLAQQVIRATERALQASPNETAATSLAARGAIIITRSLDEAAEISNRIAPEHISIPPALLPKIRNAGSIFVGDWAPQSVGDYLSGTNHVLPTATLARLRGGLSVADFVKVVTVQKLTRNGLAALAPSITTMARAEGLEGHALSVETRLKKSAGTTQKPRTAVKSAGK